jgi:hypothetical protein
MPSEAESAVVAFFHLQRSLSKRRYLPGTDRLAAAFARRADLDRADAMADLQAALWDYERAIEALNDSAANRCRRTCDDTTVAQRRTKRP